jgi:hypothetical protein
MVLLQLVTYPLFSCGLRLVVPRVKSNQKELDKSVVVPEKLRNKAPSIEVKVRGLQFFHRQTKIEA